MLKRALKDWEVNLVKVRNVNVIWSLCLGIFPVTTLNSFQCNFVMVLYFIYSLYFLYNLYDYFLHLMRKVHSLLDFNLS